MQDEYGIEIIPSPGTENKDWSEIEQKIEQKIELVKPFAKVIHIDILDGKFAANKTLLDPKPFQKYTTDIFFEMHLMVDEPINYLQQFADAGFRRFIGHVEKMSDPVAFVAEAQRLGEVGLAIDGPTSLETVSVPLIDLDTVLVMTINAGFSGQTFMPDKLEKVRTIAQKNEVIVEIDGGVNRDTIVQAVQAGATRFVVTSAIFKSEDPQKAYEELLAAATNAASLLE